MTGGSPGTGFLKYQSDTAADGWWNQPCSLVDVWFGRNADGYEALAC